MWITNDIADFADIWPRTNRLGKAVCYAFQCADILELHCETIRPCSKRCSLVCRDSEPKGDPLALFPFMIERGRQSAPCDLLMEPCPITMPLFYFRRSRMER